MVSAAQIATSLLYRVLGIAVFGEEVVGGHQTVLNEPLARLCLLVC